MRTIDADNVVEEFCRYCTLDPKKCGGDCSFPRFIERQPTVDPVRHGHKIKHYFQHDTKHELLLRITCSNCKMVVERPSYKFCPECGSMLDLSDMFEADIASLGIG